MSRIAEAVCHDLGTGRKRGFIFARYECDEHGEWTAELPVAGLQTSELADLLQVIRVRVLSFLQRRGGIEHWEELSLLDDGFAEREPALAQLAAAAVSGLPPAGPELRRRPPIRLRGHAGVQVAARLSVAEAGFSLHAATTASADDACGSEALVRYALRPPLAQERLHLVSDNLVRIELRRPFRDGTVAVELDPGLVALAPRRRGSYSPKPSGALRRSSRCRLQVARFGGTAL